MSSAMTLATCGCEEPIPNIQFVEQKCLVCGKKEKILFEVSCEKCGRMIADEKISREARQEEVRHKHSPAEYKTLLSEIRRRR